MAGFSGSMRQAERELRLKGLIKYTIGTEHVLGAGDIVSVRISEGVDTGILPGAVISAACTMVVNNSEGQFDVGGMCRGYADMAGAEITLEIGVKNDAGEWLYAPMGVYYVDDVSSEVNSAVMTLECHDGVYHRTGVAFRDEMTYPCLLGDVFNSAAEQAGYIYDGILPGENMILDRKPRWKDATVRDVMGYVAAVMGCCVLVDRWGYLDMRPLTGDRPAFVIYPEEYMARTFREGHFGPVYRVEIDTVNGEGDEESEAGQISAQAAGISGGSVLELSANPLFVTGAAHVNVLAEGMLEAVMGLEYSRCEFSWRGDPDLMPGRYLKLVGVDGEETFCTISRQTLTFDKGFHAECICGVPGSGDVKNNSLGWGGSVSAGSIVGVIPGANIGAGSITAVKLAAGSVTAEKIAAGAITAEKITAGTITADKIGAGEITADNIAAGAITADKIGAGEITADKIKAGAIDAAKIAAGAVTAEKIKADAVTAEHIKAGTITADKGIIADGAIGTAQIADGSITSAKVVELNADVIKTGTLSAERLLLVGEDGVIHKINASALGVSTSVLTEDEYKNQLDGTVIIAKSITAAQIAAQTITGNEILAGSITAKEIDVSDLFAAEATIQQLNAFDISGNKYLKLAVEDVHVGGRNYLKASDVAVSNSDYLVAKYYFGDKAPAAGEEFVVRIWGSRGDNSNTSDSFMVDVYASAGAVSLGSAVKQSDGTYVLTGVWPEIISPTQLNIYRNLNPVSTASVIERIKLEVGNKPTDWTPHWEEFKAGSSIYMTEDEVRISTAKFGVDIVGDDGETNMLTIDESGAHMESLTAPNVAPRYDGPGALYVDPDATEAQISGGSYFRSIADAMAALSHKWIPKNVTVNLASGMVEYGKAVLKGCLGSDWVSIVGDSADHAKIVGAVEIIHCSCPVGIKYLDVDSALNAVAIDVRGGYADFSGCIVTGRSVLAAVGGVDNSSSVGIKAQQGARVVVSGCEMYNVHRSLYTQTVGMMMASNNKGNARVGANRSHMFVSGTAPCNETTWGYSVIAGGQVWAGSVTVDQGSGGSAGAETTETAANATVTGAYSGSWRSDGVIRQGIYDGRQYAGCIWFSTASFSGKTIKSASLTLTRLSGSGRSGKVSLYLYTTTASGASGNPLSGMKSYGKLDGIGNGETKTFTLPVAAVQALADGTAKGLMFYEDADGVMSGKVYSANYCKIVSSGDMMPALTVNY